LEILLKEYKEYYQKKSLIHSFNQKIKQNFSPPKMDKRKGKIRKWKNK